MSARDATTRDEERVVIPCGSESLSAILTRPTVDANGTTLVFWPGKAMSIGRSALFVVMARRLAALGFHSLRFDYLGLGESTGVEREWRLEEPLSEEPVAVNDWLVARGLHHQVLVGTCFGARTVLSFADQVEDLGGLVLISAPVRDFDRGAQTASLPASEFLRRAVSKRVIQGLRDPYRRRRYRHHLRVKARKVLGGKRGDTHDDGGRVSRGFLEPLEATVRRQTPTLMIYGEDDAYYDEFQRARSGRLGRVLDSAGGVVTLHVIPDRFFGLPQVEVQQVAMESFTAWLPTVATTPARGSG